jgi:hypothetical protein
MVEWPKPKSLKALRGFFSLTGYYHNFFKGYGSIATPLSYLLKNNAFHWSERVEEAFTELKRVVTNPLMLILPDFGKPFLIEYDTSSHGIGAVLMQQQRPIAFFSRSGYH